MVISAASQHIAPATHNTLANPVIGNRSQAFGPHASKLQAIRDLTHTNLQRNLKKSVSPADYFEVESLLEQMLNSEIDFPNLMNSVNEFIETNKHNPNLSVNVLKYLNSQLMILGGVERNLNAKEAPSSQRLENGLKSFTASQGGSGEVAVQKLAKINMSAVFTAHPTNLNKPEASDIVLSQIDHVSTPHGNAKVCNELWPEQGVRATKPTVQDEAILFGQYLRNVTNASGKINKEAIAHLATLPNAPTLLKSLLEAGNWVGGDRDGNPFIDATVLRDVVKILSTVAFDHFAGKISSSKDGSLANLLGKAGHGEQLGQIREKLDRTREHLVGNSALPLQGELYLNATALVKDLKSLDITSLSPQEQQLVKNKLHLLALDSESIGFHGASTDIRQNSAMNEKTVGELLRRSGGPGNYEKLGETEKQQVITDILTNKTPMKLSDAAQPGKAENPEFEREIALVKSYKQIHDTYGPQALKNCITANTETMSDMLEVMLLLKHAGLADEKGIKMNIVPLIETVDDLHNGPGILSSMLSNNWYRQALSQTGDQQQIMVGYSDSNRLDGPLSSTWAVYEGTAKMLDVAKKQGVDLHVFHGRGGTEARGSGDSYGQEILSNNGASLATGFRQTEQGEEVPAKFGDKLTARANLSDMVGSTLETMSAGADKGIQKYASTMEQLATTARESYGSLYNDPNLPNFYQSSTPIDFVGKSNAGSRPASRATAPGGLNLDKLRAIPWVGGWYQSSMMMPAFYGTGSALKAYIENPNAAGTPQQRKAELQTMYKEWPFFKSFVDRTASAMAKGDMSVAQEYAKLADLQSQTIFHKIKSEFDLTREQLLSITQSSELMSHSPSTAETLEVKKSLTQAAHAMQIGLLRAHQNAGPDIKERLEEPLVMSMQAIASGNRFG